MEGPRGIGGKCNGVFCDKAFKKGPRKFRCVVCVGVRPPIDRERDLDGLKILVLHNRCICHPSRSSAFFALKVVDSWCVDNLVDAGGSALLIVWSCPVRQVHDKASTRP